MTLDDAMEKFHKEWGHKREPAIFQIIHALKSPCYTDADKYQLVWHLHEHWDRLGMASMRWAASTSEIRVIMARRRERVAEKMKVTDRDTAEKLIARLNSA